MGAGGAGAAAPRRGRDHFRLALGLAGAGWALLAAQQLLLYLRPTPVGTPYVLQPLRYLPAALAFEVAAAWLLSAPFLLAWVRRYDAPAGRLAPAAHLAQAALLGADLFLSGIDHEIMRHLGTHADLSFLATYLRSPAVPPAVARAVTEDPAGGWLAVALCALFPLVLLLLAAAGVRRLAAAARPGGLSRRGALLAATVPLGATLLLYALLALGAVPRQWPLVRRAHPYVAVLVKSLVEPPAGDAADFDREGAVARYQRDWLAESGDPGWAFPDPERPYLRVPVPGAAGAADAGGPWNFIVLQLETFRGRDFGFFRPDRGGPSPTPFLDALARRPDAAAWDRAMSFGSPTINAFVAVHASVPPHSERHIVTEFTWVSLLALPEALRRRGWRTAYFTATDPDWDNQRFWTRRWYDETRYWRDAESDDRLAFARARERIRELGAAGGPFLATVVSVGNHFPFEPPAPQPGGGGAEATPAERVLVSLRATDDAVRELLEPLAAEPWFARTIVVVYGDHGYDLGEHGVERRSGGSFRESTWVPLLIAGGHPALRPGLHHGPASLLDVAPTVAELAGIREANPWVGRSLLREAKATVSGARKGRLFAESPDYSLAQLDADEPALLYEADDPLQERELGAAHAADAARLAARARERARLNDWLVTADRVWRPAGGDRGGGR